MFQLAGSLEGKHGGSLDCIAQLEMGIDIRVWHSDAFGVIGDARKSRDASTAFLFATLGLSGTHDSRDSMHASPQRGLLS